MKYETAHYPSGPLIETEQHSKPLTTLVLSLPVTISQMSRLFLFWVLGVQGVFLIANGLFMLLAPGKAAETGALRGTPGDAMLIMR